MKDSSSEQDAIRTSTTVQERIAALLTSPSSGSEEEFSATAGTPRHINQALALLGGELGCDHLGLTCATLREGAYVTHTYDSWEATAKPDSPPLPLIRCMGREIVLTDDREGHPLTLPILVSDRRRSRLPSHLARALSRRELEAVCILAVAQGSGIAVIEVHFTTHPHQWRRDDVALLRDVASLFCGTLGGSGVSRASTAPAVAESVSRRPHPADLEARYRRVLDHGGMFYLRTDSRLRIVETMGDTERLLGVPAAALADNRRSWQRLLVAADLRAVIRKVRQAQREALPVNVLDEEVRIRHHLTGTLRWFLVRASPLTSEAGSLIGWEALGVDVTETRKAKEELLLQSKRIEALYAVSKVSHMHSDPAVVTFKGLRALVEATRSDCGLCCFYESERWTAGDSGLPPRPSGGALEIVASEGLSEHYIRELGKLMAGPTLVRRAVESREGILVNDIQNDPRAAVEIAKVEGLRSTLVMPLLADNVVLGAIVLFCRRANRYAEADYDVVAAAAQQMALQIRQAEYYAGEKRHAHAVSVLYRLSHELSKYLTPREVAEHAFPIILQEFAPKRLWCGVLNEQGTHLVGQAGFGPGIRSSVIGMHVDLRERTDALDQVLRTKQTMTIFPEAQHADGLLCDGLERVFVRLEAPVVILVPMVALGQTVGLLALEPTAGRTGLPQRLLHLLNSIASEMATVILARRFEAKIADAEKMRMAGLLASGVAHNFNNLLQAVMGQASLIEMQLPLHSPLTPSARMIIDAAGKGAALIKQLLSFTIGASSGSKRTVDVRKMLEESQELYRSLVGACATLSVRSEAGTFEVDADISQLQHAITNMLMNSREALGSRTDGKIDIRLKRVRLHPGELDPDLAPGSYLRIDIEDNGIGMDREHRARCFEPFFTTKNVDARTGLGLSGAGLGLSSAYSIIRGHGGVVTVESAPGKGACFSIYIPIRPPAQENSAPLTSSCKVVTCELDEESRRAIQSVCDALRYPLESTPAGSDFSALLSSLTSSGNPAVLFVSDNDLDALLSSRGSSPEEPALVVVADDRKRVEEQLARHAGGALERPHLSVLQRPLSTWAIQGVLGGRNAHRPLRSSLESEESHEVRNERARSSGTLESLSTDSQQPHKSALT